MLAVNADNFQLLNHRATAAYSFHPANGIRLILIHRCTNAVGTDGVDAIEASAAASAANTNCVRRVIATSYVCLGRTVIGFAH